MQPKRTQVDFSKHRLDVEESYGLKVYHLHKPNTIIDSVKFINTNGVLAVTGDYGNWIFCREFHPAPTDEGVSDGYWCEKLRNSSTQDPSEFDSKEAQREIKELLEDEDQVFSDEERDWLQDLSDEADEGEYAYIAKAMDRPSSYEAELIPKGKIMNFWLEVVFDAFDECCKMMKEYIPTMQSDCDPQHMIATYKRTEAPCSH